MGFAARAADVGAGVIADTRFPPRSIDLQSLNTAAYRPPLSKRPALNRKFLRWSEWSWQLEQALAYDV